MNISDHIETLGEGPRVLIVFAGVGQSAAEYKLLAGFLPDTRIYIFHLSPLVSSSIHPKRLNKKEWQQLFFAFLHKQKIEAFGLLGYSMGARLAIAVLEEAPPKSLLFCVLVAPEGIVPNGWMSFATRTWIGRKVFSKLLHQTKLLKRIAHLMASFKILTRKKLAAVLAPLRKGIAPKVVLYAWTAFGNIGISAAAIAGKVEKSAVPFLLVLGKKDALVGHRQVAPLTKLLATHHVIWLDTGHYGLVKKLIGQYPEEVKDFLDHSTEI